jgi:hypothetical protein
MVTMSQKSSLLQPANSVSQVLIPDNWPALGFFDLKEHFVAIGFALLPAYWVCWRRPNPDEPTQTRTMLTSLLALIIWWGFLTGHVVNNIMGFGS